MANQHLLSRKETQEVDCKYQRNPLFVALRPISIAWDKKATEFSLNPTDLFYQTIYSIDELKGMTDKSLRLEYCSNIWEELDYYLSEKYTRCDDTEKAASLIVGALDYCLYLIDSDYFLDEITILKKKNEENVSGIGTDIYASFKRWLGTETENVSKWLRKYYESVEMISDNIEDIVNVIRENENDDVREKTENIVNMLKPLFYGNEKYAREFLSAIKGRDGIDVAKVAQQFVEETKLIDSKKIMPLYNILNPNGYYTKSDRAWRKVFEKES